MQQAITAPMAPLAADRPIRPFSRMMSGLRAALAPAQPVSARANPTLPVGPSHEALIDADYERLASFGSWSSLRDTLRESANATPAIRRSA